MACLKTEGSFTIGIIYGITYSGGSLHRPTSYMYEYTINHKTYKNSIGNAQLSILRKDSELPTIDELEKGIKFMVIYDPNDYHNSILHIGYAVSDSLSLISQIAKYKNN